ncbi:MAG: tetratricopeptide repeat protein, partial [Methylococcaceae bacterium]|nr:tetratricopeptide repeat protein [Methylococcaceae bacterium]
PSTHDHPPAINNLPRLQDAGFFGRSQELWHIERAFVQNVRSLAIVGFGGQGKTTLAIAAGDWLQQTGLFARVCFVDYAAFQGIDAVAMAISTLATVLQASLLDADAATRALQQTATLVILDNVEALTPQVSAALLTAAAAWALAGNSRVLITTRQDDLAHPAYPTAHTSQHVTLRLQGLGPEDALAYFQRLHKLPPAPLHQTPERAALLALFKRVDFHPLSISLLAGALKVTRLANLGPRLEHYLAENPGNPLLGSLKLSLDRLPAEVRVLVPRLGVFQGGAMEHKLLEITEINADDWALLRPALAYTGLLHAEALADYSVPYLKFHPTLAPALWQELTDSEQAGLVARYRHSYYQLSEYLYHEDDKNPHAVRAIALRELPNCLHGVYAALQAGEAFAVEFANYVSSFLNDFGLQADKAALNQAALAASGDIGTDAWYLAQSNQGLALFDAGHYAPAASIFETLRLQLGQTPSHRLCDTLDSLGRCFNELGNTAAAISCYQQALALAQQLETSRSTQQLISRLHTDLADAFAEAGDYAQAQTQYGLSLAIKSDIGGDTRGVAVVQLQLGTLAMRQGDLAVAEQRYQTALSLFSELHEPQSEATVWHQLGLVYQTAKSWTAAEHAYRESARLKEALGDTLGAASTWTNLASVNQLLGQADAAEQWYRKAIAVQQQGNPKHLAMSLNNLADLLQKQAGRLEEARVLAEQALAIKKTLDAASAEIWNTYHLLAEIAEKQHASAQASQYRQCARASYLGFAGMPTQMQANAGLIAAVQQAVLTHTVEPELAADLQDWHQNGWTDLVSAIKQLLNGERNPAVLLEPLDYTDAAIIHLILTAIAQPDSL